MPQQFRINKLLLHGDGSNAGLSAFNYLEKLKGKPGIRADWKKQIGGQVFHY